MFDPMIVLTAPVLSPVLTTIPAFAASRPNTVSALFDVDANPPVRSSDSAKILTLLSEAPIVNVPFEVVVILAPKVVVPFRVTLALKVSTLLTVTFPLIVVCVVSSALPPATCKPLSALNL